MLSCTFHSTLTLSVSCDLLHCFPSSQGRSCNSAMKCVLKLPEQVDFPHPPCLNDLLPESAKKKQAQNGVTSTKPHQNVILNLMAVSASPRSGILYQSVWNFLVCTSEVILPETILSFLLLITFLSCSISVKDFHFVQLGGGAAFYLLDVTLCNS